MTRALFGRVPNFRFGTLRLRIAVLFTILFAAVMAVVMLLVGMAALWYLRGVVTSLRPLIVILLVPRGKHSA